MNRDDKINFVSEIKEKIKGKSSVLIVHYHGLTVANMSELRGIMFKAGANLQVVKNRLMKIAIEGTVFSELKDKFTGPVAIAYSADPISAAKAIASFAKTHDKLKIIGGIVDNQYADVTKIQYLATIPSLDELRSKIIGLISAPASKIARVCSAYGSKNN